MGLVRHTEISTRDADEAVAAVSGIFCDHTLTPLTTGAGGVRMSLRADQLGPLSLVHLDYGDAVTIRPAPISEFYLVQIPRGGRAHVRQDATSVVASVATASVLSPMGEVSMTWGEANPHLCVYLSREAVERELAALTGRPVTRPLVFDVGMKLDGPEAASWLRGVLFLVDELRRGTTLVQRPELVDSFTATIAGQLLMAQRHNYSNLLTASEPIVPATAQRAVDFIEAHVGDSGLNVSVIAASLGVSARTLQDAFRKELGTTPLAYIKDRRMAIAHRRLLAGDPLVTTVTRIAAGVGISHLGRFSVEYHQRFGEPPSATLNRH